MREDSEEVIISRIWDNHGKEVGYEQKGVLVRCKDCKWWNGEQCLARKIEVVDVYDYCSYGERNNDERK